MRTLSLKGREYTADVVRRPGHAGPRLFTNGARFRENTCSTLFTNWLLHRKIALVLDENVRTSCYRTGNTYYTKHILHDERDHPIKNVLGEHLPCLREHFTQPGMKCPRAFHVTEALVTHHMGLHWKSAPERIAMPFLRASCSLVRASRRASYLRGRRYQGGGKLKLVCETHSLNMWPGRSALN